MSSFRSNRKDSRVISFEADSDGKTSLTKSSYRSLKSTKFHSSINSTEKSSATSSAKSRKSSLKLSKSKKIEQELDTTSEAEIKENIITSVKEESKFVKVPVPCKLPKISNLSLLSNDLGETTITVPAIEKKTVTTVQKIRPKKTENLVVTALEPIITVTRDKNIETTKIKTPINKHLTTTTTVQRSTTTTTETTILIGKAAKAIDPKTVGNTKTMQFNNSAVTSK